MFIAKHINLLILLKSLNFELIFIKNVYMFVDKHFFDKHFCLSIEK